MVTRPRKDWISRTPKWVLLAAFWMVQGAVLYFGQALLYTSQGEVQGYEYVELPDGRNVLQRVDDTSLLGRWPSREEYLRLLTMTDFILWMGGGIAAITLAQALFVWPVRRPGVMGPGGKGARTSLCIAGMAIGALVLAVVMAWYGVADEYDLWGPQAIDDLPLPRWMVVAVIVGTGWAVATPLLFAFVKGGPRETVLARLSRRLLLGTMVEVALLIPLDVMVRRKTSCYCWAGTYWALTVCGAVGVFALGPAVFLPLVARRRKAWYAGHCGVCGYDMAGRMDAPKCPECGTGWRA
jgi:hypothetical protein